MDKNKSTNTMRNKTNKLDKQDTKNSLQIIDQMSIKVNPQDRDYTSDQVYVSYKVIIL